MAYCTWSSDDYKSDVYVYEHVDGGWTTHVAAFKRVYQEELPPPVRWDPDDPDAVAKWWERERKVREIVERMPLVRIGGPYDGETFRDPTPGACADRLEMLREAGYYVPQYAIDALRAEQQELDNERASEGPST